MCNRALCDRSQYDTRCRLQLHSWDLVRSEITMIDRQAVLEPSDNMARPRGGRAQDCSALQTTARSDDRTFKMSSYVAIWERSWSELPCSFAYVSLSENWFAKPHPSFHPKRRRYVEERLLAPTHSCPIPYRTPLYVETADTAPALFISFRSGLKQS